MPPIQEVPDRAHRELNGEGLMWRFARWRAFDVTRLSSIVGLLALFALLDWWFRSLTQVPEEVFAQRFLFGAFLQHHVASPWRVASLLAVALPLVLRYREAGGSWHEMEHGQAIRVLVVAAGLAERPSMRGSK